MGGSSSTTSRRTLSTRSYCGTRRPLPQAPADSWRTSTAIRQERPRAGGAERTGIRGFPTGEAGQVAAWRAWPGPGTRALRRAVGGGLQGLASGSGRTPRARRDPNDRPQTRPATQRVTLARALPPRRAFGVLIRIDSVTKRYPDGTVAVDRLSLDVPDRSITVLVGPSGCGKTTTLRMINRMVDPTEGTILLDGEDIRRRPVTTLRRSMGYVIQNAGLFQHRTIVDNIATVPRMLGWGRQRARQRAAELMERVG